ncbi:hypothetical protein THAOC_21166 [Thalassiosira oceanica]|uniref:AAA+ ATPase domain-containing protein n=1 Tax=Thalassiosira oceanica TaxID=159749 RepID=K0RY81_THAOC|nr:hypothetical protein THAOC_21166 [Thalassiosira oceanica]|eukprot:EJK58688.1 hypothetical protein THAOC_21166 [Thalassiosira oceanica]
MLASYHRYWVVALLSCYLVGKASSFSAPQLAPRRPAVAERVSRPSWKKDAVGPPMHRRSRVAGGLFAAENDGSPLRKRDRLLLMVRAAVKFVLRLRRRTSAKIFLMSLVGAFLLGGGDVVANCIAPTDPVERVPFSAFMQLCEGKGAVGRESSECIEAVTVDTATNRLRYTILRAEDRTQRAAIRKLRSGGAADTADVPRVSAETDSLIDGSELVSFMRKNNVAFGAGPSTKKGDGVTTAVVLLAAYKFLNGSASTSPSESPGKVARKKRPSDAVSFDDIQGIDDAKYDVMELVDSLRFPEKYSLVGARPPKGVLLEGPPGCGKTSLARACADSADVPLIHCSGSDFVETYVGKGAARVRRLFQKARAVEGPCLIFVDEIDAIGKRRSSSGSGGGGRDEAEQTLNALLTCLDGLESSDDEMICVLGATNRVDTLDPALTRTGRFDRIIKVNLPTEDGRLEILRAHAEKLPGFTEEDGSGGVNLQAVAAATEGLSGSDLEVIINEAAIRAARRVSIQLNAGLEVNTKIYQEDVQDSLTSFFQSRRLQPKFET